MNIHLNDKDINSMPEPLRTSFLDWVLDKGQSNSCSTPILSVHKRASAQQLILEFPSRVRKEDNSRVKLTQLFDAGMTKSGMLVRVRLKRKLADKLGRKYINNLEISDEGTIIYNGEEFDQPSPLAKKINEGESNGWEYVEVKRNHEWVCLDELRQTWRNTNG